MKLTKVLVGLLAISLCGVAAAAVKKGMAPEDLRAGFIKAVKGEKTTEATEFINALKARGDWDYYYRTMIKADLKEMANGTALIEKYIGKVEAKKIEPVKDLTKPGEDTTKPPVTVTGWKAEWGTPAPAWASIDCTKVTDELKAAVGSNGALESALDSTEVSNKEVAKYLLGKLESAFNVLADPEKSLAENLVGSAKGLI